MGRSVHQWPGDEELLAALAAAGGPHLYARQIGVAPSTLHSYLVRSGLRDRAREVISQRPVGELVNEALEAARAIPTGEVTREERLDAEVRELRSALKVTRKTDVASSRIVEAVQTALEDVELRLPMVAEAPPLSTDAHHRQLVVWSDWHGGETVNPDVVNGLNDYSWDIMEQRAQELVRSMLSHKRRSPELSGLDIVLGGDMCSGANHDEITISNEYPLAEQAVRMGYLIASAVEALVPHYPDIRIVAVEGNHPRLVKAPAAKEPHNNGDWIASVLARERLRAQPSVSSFQIGRGSAFHQIAGRNVYVFHGDGIRSSMPGVPWGGVMRRANTIASAYPQRIDHFLLGHFHQANVVNSGRIIMNGSLKGTDEWVQKNFGAGEPPSQLLLTFDERKSRMTDVKFLTPSAGL